MDTFKATDPRVDAYIENAEEFAKPILRKLRKLVHQACPDAHETIKWSFAAFDYKGPFCSMASFKEHCAFGFWKASLMEDPNSILVEEGGSGMGHLGRISSETDLPPDEVIIELIQQAKKLNDDGIKLPPRERKVDETQLEIPEDFTTALTLNILAQNQFDNFTPGKKKEYIVWITEAKAADTRKRRVETAIEWISEGKGRNWKYEKK